MPLQAASFAGMSTLAADSNYSNPYVRTSSFMSVCVFLVYKFTQKDVFLCRSVERSSRSAYILSAEVVNSTVYNLSFLFFLQ